MVWIYEKACFGVIECTLRAWGGIIWTEHNKHSSRLFPVKSVYLLSFSVKQFLYLEVIFILAFSVYFWHQRRFSLKVYFCVIQISFCTGFNETVTNATTRQAALHKIYCFIIYEQRPTLLAVYTIVWAYFSAITTIVILDICSNVWREYLPLPQDWPGCQGWSD